ncbi:hypothetical protein J1N09_11415 [Aureitalea sp. L0-47]|uniref:hypothetical protein n=1 Tax=Aureitalea sp. L0-47 TaxID=2816962 RepID=UPI00223885AA|nr:hypothetical protein [Aureitalea sp. L0-47]MCW5520452.1 hypothetical protein [Aureitalea sp. L0-47]
MKIKISSILILAILSFSVKAQSGKEHIQSAKKAFTIYKIDNSNAAKFVEATDNIDAAINDSETTNEAAVWLLRGDIYNEIANQKVIIRQLGFGDASKLPKRQYPALTALEAYVKAKKLAQKKYETKEAVNGIRTVQNNISTTGVMAFEDGDYQGAYLLLSSVLEAHTLLKNAGADSALDTEDEYNNQVFISGLAALNARMNSEAKMHLEELYRKKYEKPSIYEALYSIASADQNTDINDAYKYIEEGRKLFPDDVSLLFAEINHFLKTNQLDELVAKLKSAIEKEPENVSLYVTLGNVYDGLYQQEAQGGDPDMQNLYFSNALDYYKQGIAKDPENAMATYSIGALYFNKAAMESKVLMVLADDFSSEGVKKYEKKEAEIMALFDKAMPYFQRAEHLNPNDISTLMALKEIYARKEDFAKMKIFNDRLQVVQQGGTNSTPYFSN